MATPNFKVIHALRETADQIQNSGRYEWGHMGGCNCGHLAQNITSFTRAEIQRFALQKRGDWSEQVIDYCPTSGFPMDLIIGRMIEFGFSRADLRQLENLSNPEVLAKIGVSYLNRNVLTDTVLYFYAWANLLEDQWVASVQLPDFETKQLVC